MLRLVSDIRTKHKMPFAAMLMANKALLLSSLVLTGNAFRYLGHDYLLY